MNGSASLRPIGLALVSCGLLCACADLAPPYQRPDAPVADAWPTQPPAMSETPGPADAGWDDAFLDDRLRRIIELALANNRGLRATLQGVLQAQAQYRVQASSNLPSLGLDASIIHASAAGVATNTATLGVATSSYELDLFGQVRNANAAALQAYLASAEGARAARIALACEVATQWLTFAADVQQQQLNERMRALDERSLQLTQRMHDLGAIKGLPVAQAQAALEASRGTVAAGRSQLQLDRDALVLLTGQELPDAVLPTQAPVSPAAALPGVPPGLPSRLLQQRPDVLAAEHALRQAQLDIGVARARFFPAITLTGSAGTSSNALSGLFKAGTRTWSFGPSISLPLLDGGALQAGLDASRAAREVALANYDKAIQTAFREVADALAVRATLDERIEAQKAQTRASQAAARDAEALFRHGSVSYLEVLAAQRNLYASQQSEILLNLAEQNNRVALYKALGGPWKESN